MEKGNEKKPKAPPVLVSRRDNRKSSFKLGRTIGEKREKLETANERAVARKKDKKKKTFRITFTLVGFLIISIILVVLCVTLINGSKESAPVEIIDENSAPAPTIEIVDEDSTRAGGKLTGRMVTYIGQVEQSFRELGYNPLRAVVPAGKIREVDFYLEGKPGFIKLLIDRGAGVSVEDADRMIRYLASNGVENYSYIDVRIDKKAYWK